MDRGLFVSTYFRTYKEQNNKNHSNGEEEFFTKPAVKALKPYNYDKLAGDGFVPENSYVEGGDIIIGKCMPQKIGNVINNKDNSVAFKNNDKGYVDRNVYNDNYFTTVNGDGYTFAKVRIRSDRVPTIGDKLSCYDEETQVLTNKGWIHFKELTLDHKVASIVDNKLVYQKPTEIISSPFEGKMYKVKSNQIDLLVTDNHRMYVRTRTQDNYDVEEARDIYGARRHYKKNVDEWVPDLTDAPEELVVQDDKVVAFKIEDLVFQIDDWLAFFGIWIAEGCASTGKINIAAHKERVKEVLDIVCPRMGLDVHKYKYHPEETEDNSWNILDKMLYNYMLPLSLGSINKFLPDWVWYLDMEQSRSLIEAMCLGDGHTMKNGTKRYDTSSTVLADHFQRLCLHAGWSSNKALKDVKDTVGEIRATGQVFKRNADAWRLTIVKSQNKPLVNKNKVPGDPESYLDSWVEYKGNVYCCTVPHGPGVVYVKRNGIVCWSGNSRSGQLRPR